MNRPQSAPTDRQRAAARAALAAPPSLPPRQVPRVVRTRAEVAEVTHVLSRIETEFAARERAEAAGLLRARGFVRFARNGSVESATSLDEWDRLHGRAVRS